MFPGDGHDLKIKNKFIITSFILFNYISPLFAVDLNWNEFKRIQQEAVDESQFLNYLEVVQSAFSESMNENLGKINSLEIKKNIGSSLDDIYGSKSIEALNSHYLSRLRISNTCSPAESAFIQLVLSDFLQFTLHMQENLGEQIVSMLEKNSIIFHCVPDNKILMKTCVDFLSIKPCASRIPETQNLEDREPIYVFLHNIDLSGFTLKDVDIVIHEFLHSVGYYHDDFIYKEMKLLTGQIFSEELVKKSMIKNAKILSPPLKECVDFESDFIIDSTKKECKTLLGMFEAIKQQYLTLR